MSEARVPRPAVLIAALRDVLALGMGIASATLGMGAWLLVGYSLVIRLGEERTSLLTYLFRMTHPFVLAYVLGAAALAAIPGGLAWVASRRPAEERTKVSLAASARRFARAGLVCAVLLGLLCVSCLAYRWYTWGWASLVH